ncbi:pentapeptide repeat-containing protein [Bradyrhizobium sp. B124]|uniref:pentapeptide repeat-containing protein n=1 Tax=Bradyrhizobium sp. B124 TaxID=3140245 RepID=UPI0031839839
MDKVPNLSAESEAKDIPRTKEAPKEPDPYDFNAIERAVNEAAKSVNNVWIAFISLCVYIFIATYGVTPATLFRDSTVRLPIFNADLPLKVYFLMAPTLILAVHAYLIVLTKGLSEKIQTYEDALRQPRSMAIKIAAGRRAVRARLDNSIISATVSARYRETFGGVSIANGLIAGLTMTAMPVALLLLTQLIFLPYQHEHMSWLHRSFVLIDVGVCLWFLWPLTARPLVLFGRILALLFIGVVATTSVFLAVFPGEWIYNKLEGHFPHAITDKLFEGSSDPIDYVSKGGVLPFANRLILPDDPKLAEVTGAPSNSVSLSVRGRSFRRAIFDRSNLVRVDFSAADLQHASLRGTRLEGSKFDCAGSAIVTFRGPTGGFELTYKEEGNFVCAKLNGANLAYAHLDGASFEGAQLSGSALNDTTVTGTDFSDSVLLGARFSGAVGRGPTFSGARLIAADLSNAQLFAADFERASLEGASLAYSSLQAANFRDSRMQGVDASNTLLQGSSFEGTFLHAASFLGARIQGVSFKDAALPNASLMCLVPFRNNFQNADRSQTVVKKEEECSAGWFDYTFYENVTHPLDEKYSLPTDALPSKRGYVKNDFQPYMSGAVAPEFLRPETLDDETFSTVLEKSTSDLPGIAKARATQGFEPLRPSARTKLQDDAEKGFWTDWAKQSATQKSHEEALAARLESIACVAVGAPYVARHVVHRLLRAWPSNSVDTSTEANEQINRSIERIRKARDGSDPDCLGAVGLVE